MAETKRGKMIILAETNKQKVEDDGERVCARARARARAHTHTHTHTQTDIHVPKHIIGNYQFCCLNLYCFEFILIFLPQCFFPFFGHTLLYP